MGVSMSLNAQTWGWGTVQVQGASNGLRVFSGPNPNSHHGNQSWGSFTSGATALGSSAQVSYQGNVGDTIYAGVYDCNGNYISAADIVSQPRDTLQFNLQITCMPDPCESVGDVVTYTTGGRSFLNLYNLVDTTGMGATVPFTVTWSNGTVISPAYDTATVPLNATAYCIYQNSCGATFTYCDSVNNNGGGSGNPGTCTALFTFDTINSINFGGNLVLWNMSSTTAAGNLDYIWDWGDGNYSNGQYPSHTYIDTGVYNICLTVIDSANACTDTYCDSIGFDANGNLVYKTMQGFSIVVIDPATIGQNENSLESLIDFYPNPANSNFWIEAPTNIESVLVYSLSGELVQRISSDKLDGQRVEVTIQNSGLYIIEVHTHQGIARKKMLIQN